MSDIKNISLRFNCPNTRDSLEKTSNGFHCSSCSKEVIDFTTKTQSELQEIINKSNAHVCGIFKQSQLSKTFVKYAAATVIAGSTFVSTAQGQHTIQADTVEQACELMGDILFGEVVDGSADQSFYYPEPIGGMEKFYEALMSNIKYPDSLNENGRTYLRFTVDTKGAISKVEVIKGFNKYADKEAVRALKTLNFPFKPADKDGSPVESQLIIPVNFGREKN